MRCGGGSINWGRYGSCYSFACYPELGRLPDLEALTYLRDCVSHRAQLLCRRPQCLAVPLQSQTNQQTAGGYQIMHIASALLRFVSGFASVHAQGKEMLCAYTRSVKGYGRSISEAAVANTKLRSGWISVQDEVS